MSLMTDRSGRLPRQERRAQLLDAAREAFVLQGYHAAGMDGIAELAGVSKPVLYQHFPGKLELYLAVLDESSDSLIQRVRTALDSTHDNRKRVRATFEAYFDFVAHESGAFRLIFESDLTNVPEAASRVQRTNETCALMIAEVIREDTELEPDVAMMLAMGLLGMAQTAARHWLHSPAPISQEGAARAMSALAWRGISGFPLTAHPARVPEKAGAGSSAAARSSEKPATPTADTDVTASAPVADTTATPKTRSAGAKAQPQTSARARSRSSR
jgi:AcrR family transcriptional regulator